MVDVAYDSPVDARDDFRKIWGTDDLRFLSRYDGLRRFRLTKLGAYCLGLSAAYSPKPITQKASFTVMPSLRLIVSGELSPDEESMFESACLVLNTFNLRAARVLIIFHRLNRDTLDLSKLQFRGAPRCFALFDNVADGLVTP